jgi:hypothetical protein
MMQTWGPTLCIMDSNSSGEVTSMETHRLVFFSVMMERRRLVRGFFAFLAKDS